MLCEADWRNWGGTNENFHHINNDWIGDVCDEKHKDKD